MTKRAKTVLNISILVISIGVTVTVLALNYKELNFANIFGFLAEGNPWYIVAAAACMVLFIVFEGLALMLISRRLGFKCKVRSAMAYSASDVYYSAITPSASGGQPASLFYMMRDGMGAGVAGFSLVFNLMAYTSAVIIMGVFAFIACPGIFTQMGSMFSKTLVILGFIIQILILGFFILCLFCHKAILKIGNGIISLLTKIKIVKKPDKWRARLTEEVEKYRACRAVIKEHKSLFIEALILNLLQRVSQTLIPCFVCLSASNNADALQLFSMQAFVLLGYNSIPLPGGVGAYEYLYLKTYCVFFDDKFILSAMTVSRFFSYYCSLLVSGLYTLIYHTVGMRGKKSAENAPAMRPEDSAVQNGVGQEGDVAACLEGVDGEAVIDETNFATNASDNQVESEEEHLQSSSHSELTEDKNELRE